MRVFAALVPSVEAVGHLDDAVAAVRWLSTAVLSAVEGFGWMLDRRVFSPHLVLGRSPATVDARPVVELLSGYAGPGWLFDTLVILWARPVDDGAVEPDIVEMYPMTG